MTIYLWFSSSVNNRIKIITANIIINIWFIFINNILFIFREYMHPEDKTQDGNFLEGLTPQYHKYEVLSDKLPTLIYEPNR